MFSLGSFIFFGTVCRTYEMLDPKVQESECKADVFNFPISV